MDYYLRWTARTEAGHGPGRSLVVAELFLGLSTAESKYELSDLASPGQGAKAGREPRREPASATVLVIQRPFDPRYLRQHRQNSLYWAA